MPSNGCYCSKLTEIVSEVSLRQVLGWLKEDVDRPFSAGRVLVLVMVFGLGSVSFGQGDIQSEKLRNTPIFLIGSDI